MGTYSKLIGALVGNVVAMLLAWAAVNWPAITTCSVAADGAQACTIIGFTQTQITAALMAIVNMIAVHQFPANKPPS